MPDRHFYLLRHHILVYIIFLVFCPLAPDEISIFVCGKEGIVHCFSTDWWNEIDSRCIQVEQPAELSGNYNNEKRIFINIAFCDFVLQNFDSENFGLVFPKFSFFEAKWSV